jgi:hypothetical protein
MSAKLGSTAGPPTAAEPGVSSMLPDRTHWPCHAHVHRASPGQLLCACPISDFILSPVKTLGQIKRKLNHSAIPSLTLSSILLRCWLRTLSCTRATPLSYERTLPSKPPDHFAHCHPKPKPSSCRFTTSRARPSHPVALQGPNKPVGPLPLEDRPVEHEPKKKITTIVSSSSFCPKLYPKTCSVAPYPGL